MSGDDADLSAAYSLILLRRRNESRNESNENSKDGCRKSTTINVDTFIRCPLRDSSNNNPLFKNVGVVTKEAGNALSQWSAIGKMMKYGSTLGKYPACYTGFRKCHFRVLYSVSPKAAESAYSKKVKHHEESKIQECLQQLKGHTKGKVYWLHGMHWVSLSPSFYTDNAYCWPVVNFEVAGAVLDLLQSSPKNNLSLI
jgi:hypothetical protein